MAKRCTVRILTWIVALTLGFPFGFPGAARCAEENRSGELVAKAEQYKQAKDQLRSRASWYWVDDPFVVLNPKTGNSFSTCAWTDFIPTVMPTVDIVVLVTAKEKDKKNELRGWIPQRKLQDIMGPRLEYHSTPVPHLVTPLLVPLQMQKRIESELSPMETLGEVKEQAY